MDQGHHQHIIISQTLLLLQAVGWEELTEASLTHLLRSCLARSQKDAAVVPTLTAHPDPARVEKLMSLVFERLSRGMRLCPTA